MCDTAEQKGMEILRQKFAEQGIVLEELLREIEVCPLIAEMIAQSVKDKLVAMHTIATMLDVLKGYPIFGDSG